MVAKESVNTLEPCRDCPFGALSLPGSYVRCQQCRNDHKAGKAADAQWDARERRRESMLARRARQGRHSNPGPPPRPREHTPSWDQYGRVIPKQIEMTPNDLEAIKLIITMMEKSIILLRTALRNR